MEAFEGQIRIFESVIPNTVKIWIDAGVYNAYLADAGEADVSEIMEKALKMYFGKAV